MRMRSRVAAAAVAGLVASASARADPAAEAPPITVTGHHLSDYAAALDACIAAHCPPRADIVASVRYAEALFRSGKYLDAREVLAKATRRNADAGRAEPLALSQLYLAQASVAAHVGEQRDVREATLASARIADQFLPAGDRDRLLADLRLADWRLNSQRFERTGANLAIADGDYARIADVARASGHADVAAAADLHLAWALHARRDDARAGRLLAGVAATADAATRPYRLAARVLQARVARERGDTRAVDAVIASLRGEPDLATPVLVYAPPLPHPTDVVYRDDPFRGNFDPVTRPSDVQSLRWVDIGFAIRPDGSVDMPEVLRGSPSAGWAKPLLAMVAARRYSPSAGDAGHYRVERFTLTADYGTPAGSLIRRRVFEPRFEQLDLTDDAPRRSS